MADRGRPRHAESAERRKHFVRLVLAGAQLKDAALESQIQPLRALSIIDELAALRIVEIDPREAAA